MIKKIKIWYNNYKLAKQMARAARGVDTIHPEERAYTREQLEKAFELGYNDGKRDGLAIARQQATKSLKEILWQQNNQSQK